MAYRRRSTMRAAVPPAVLAVLCLLAVPAAAADVARIAAGLQPHRAIYDMSLGEANDQASVQGVTGRIVTEFTGSVCEGFTTSFRFVSRIDDQDGGSRLTDLRTSSYETADASTYQFITQNYVDRTLAEETRGVATRDGDSVVVDLVKPQAKQLKLPGASVFPMQHILEAIGVAEAGGTVFQASLYDGGDKGEKTMTTTAIIGKAVQGDDVPGGDDAGAVAKIGGGARWPVKLSYFDSTSAPGEQTPAYELSFLLYPNGISRRLVLDYGDFSIVGKLTSIELLDRKPCKP